MKWKPAFLEKIKPSSWSSHGAWGMVIGLIWAMLVTGHLSTQMLFLLCVMISVSIAIIWEWAYWHVSRWFRKRRGIVYKARGWPDVPPDAIVVVEPRHAFRLPPDNVSVHWEAKRKVNQWCNDTGAIYEHTKMSVQEMVCSLYIHPAFDRRRGSWLDVVPWPFGSVIGAALGVAILAWRG